MNKIQPVSWKRTKRESEASEMDASLFDGENRLKQKAGYKALIPVNSGNFIVRLH